ncbi:hypothetical protein BV20DRAFT_1059417 [Pilatotrama ljubarskyi]|nr:hypothetical protein BV20DRAFT_1059417 [Pilatotrama ljubarskyi]
MLCIIFVLLPSVAVAYRPWNAELSSSTCVELNVNLLPMQSLPECILHLQVRLAYRTHRTVVDRQSASDRTTSWPRR